MQNLGLVGRKFFSGGPGRSSEFLGRSTHAKGLLWNITSTRISTLVLIAQAVLEHGQTDRQTDTHRQTPLNALTTPSATAGVDN